MIYIHYKLIVFRTETNRLYKDKFFLLFTIK